MINHKTLKRLEGSEGSGLALAIAIIPENERPEEIYDLLPKKRKVPVGIVGDATLYLVVAKKLIKYKVYDDAIEKVYEGIHLAEKWNIDYLKVDLYTTLVNVYRLKTKFKSIIKVTDKAIEYTETNEQKIILYELNSDALVSLNMIDEAFRKKSEMFDLIGFKFNYTKPEIGNLKSIYYALEEISEEWQLALIRLAKGFAELCLFKCPNKVPDVVLAEVSLTLKYGWSPLALCTFIDYAILLFVFFGEFEEGYRIAKQAVDLIEETKDSGLSIVSVLGGFFAIFYPWKHPLRESLIPLKRAVESGLEEGDFMLTNAYSLARIDHLTILGTKLEELKRENLESLETFKKMKLPYSFDNTNIYLQMILNLQGESERTTELKGFYFDESNLEKIHNPIHRYMFFLVKTILFYLFDEPQKAVESAKSAELYSGSMLKYVVTAQLAFYKLLSLLACPNSTKEEIEPGLKQLEKWAKDCPSNFEHWYQLANAEWLRIQRCFREAMQHYERAIALAEEQERIQDAALANKLKGKFHLQQGENEDAEKHLKAAHAVFVRWGAVAVAQKMEEEYPCLRVPDFNTDLAQAICIKLIDGDSLINGDSSRMKNIKKMLSRIVSSTYYPTTKKLVLVAESKVAAALLAPYLATIQGQELQDVTVILKLA